MRVRNRPRIVNGIQVPIKRFTMAKVLQLNLEEKPKIHEEMQCKWLGTHSLCMEKSASRGWPISSVSAKCFAAAGELT